MTNNKKLIGLCISDFTKLHSIREIETACSLTSFQLYDRVYASMEIESFQPIVSTHIKHFTWGGKSVLDNNYECLAKSEIETLNLSPRRFTMLELAQLLALFPKTLNGSITKPYVKGGVKDNGEYTEYYFLCKGKRTCVVGKDDERFSNYLKEFEALLKRCRENQKL